MPRRLIFLVVVLMFVAACSQPASVPEKGKQPPASAPAAENKRPKFESELVATLAVNGGSGSFTHKSIVYDNGRPFVAVDHYATTVNAGDVTLKYDLAFVAHRDGKDVYKVTTKVEHAGSSETKTSEATYDGTRAVITEDQYCSLFLQPPSK